MILPPKMFTTICAIAEVPDEKINQNWQDTFEKVISDFLNWLINETGLTEKQQGLLEKALTDIVNSQLAKDKSILELVRPILDENQQDEAVDKFAELFTINLENFYTTIKNTMTLEQKQVADSYIKTSYVGNNS